MTREEKTALLVNELEDIRCDFYADTDEDKTLKEAIRLIKALEQEPCEDAISRAEVRHLIAETNRKDLGCMSTKAFKILYDGIDALPSVNPQEPKWIPVSERLPEDGTYLVTVERIVGELGIDMKSFAKDLNRVDEYDFPKHKCGWYDYDSEYGYWEDTGIIAWMPLPKPYKAESEEV